MQWRGSTEALEEDSASHAWRHRLLVDVDVQELQAEDDRTCHEHRPAQAMRTTRTRTPRAHLGAEHDEHGQRETRKFSFVPLPSTKPTRRAAAPIHAMPPS
jgi:hypothetical protein